MHYAGLEEAILRCIGACREITQITRTSYGPLAMKKLIVNHIDKMFITNDVSTMLKEIDVNHPAAKLLVMAAKMQKDDFGDLTNYTLTLAGELLGQAETLIKGGLHPSAIITGFELGLEKAVEILNNNVSLRINNLSDKASVAQIMRSALGPKLPSYFEFFGDLVTDACLSILQEQTPRFNSDNIRCIRILGGSLEMSTLVNGFVIARGPENSDLTTLKKVKVAAYSCPFDPQGGETKGTVLIKTADELIKYSNTEEALAERIVKGLSEADVKVVAVGGSISELCLHFLSKYGIFVLKIQSKFELQRLCKAINAIALADLNVPTAEEMGYSDSISVKEIGSTRVTVFEKSDIGSKLCTIVLRGTSNSIMEDAERALENAVSVFKQAINDNRFVAGAGASECYLQNSLELYSSTLTGLEQYSVAAYGQSFENFVRILLENAGMNPNELLPNVLSGNQHQPEFGVDVLNSKLSNSSELGVYENTACKINALKLATHAAVTILRIDQIIVSKPAGGPKPKENKGWDND